MQTITVMEAQIKIDQLLDKAADFHEPIQIIGKQTNAVLVSEEDWRAIEESLYLLSLPGMRDSIQEGMKTPVSECDMKLIW